MLFRYGDSHENRSTIILSPIVILPLFYGCSVSGLHRDEAPEEELWHRHRPMLEIKEKEEERHERKNEALDRLDKVLSPFEDMTEYALDTNIDGMKKTFSTIRETQDRQTFSNIE